MAPSLRRDAVDEDEHGARPRPARTRERGRHAGDDDFLEARLGGCKLAIRRRSGAADVVASTTSSRA
jgi:hypothetical protein